MVRKGITLEDFDRMHVEDGRLFWDDQEVITEKRWGVVERRIAIAGLLIGGIGVAATVAQAWAALLPPSTTSDFQYCVELLREDPQTDPVYLLSMCKDR